MRSGRDKVKRGYLEVAADPSIPREAFESHFRRLKSEHELAPKWHLRSEVQFLLVAVKGAYEMARVIRTAVADDPERVRCVQAAVSTFEKVAPGAVHLRSIHEHLDELLLERGDAFRKLPDPTMEGVIALLDDDIAYEIGRKASLIKPLAVAAKDLVRDVTRCAQDS